MPPKILTKPPIPQSADWRRVMETGMQFTELRRSQARAIVSDLVSQGHVARDQMTAAVDEVVEMSRRRREDVRRMVQHEVQRQLGALGLATKADLTALERRMTRAGRDAKDAKKATAKKSAKKKPSPKDSATAKKSAPTSASKAG
jgi:polyhydroxyalkanoate synthesis regulator phasin